MTSAQVAILVLMGGLLAAFAIDRIRIELVALGGLAVAFALGLVGEDHLFSGFASPAVITVVEILMIVQVLERTRAIDAVAARVVAHIRGERAAIVVLCVGSAAVSVFINNIGALALMLPIALAVCSALGVPLARVLMPMSFATLLGGLCSVVGTPANLVVSQSLQAASGAPLGFFDLASIGLPLTIVGIAYLAWRAPSMRLPAGGTLPAAPSGFGQRRMIAELTVQPRSDLVGLAPGAVDTALAGRVHAILRDGKHLFGRRDHLRIAAGDVLLVEAPAATLERMRASGSLAYPSPTDEDAATTALVDAVVLPESVIAGSRLGTIAAFSTRGIAVVAVASTAARRIEGRFADLALGIGDVFVLRGGRTLIEQALAEVDALPLQPRRAEASRSGALAIGAFALGILAAAAGLLAPEVAFGLVLLSYLATGALRLREGLEAINWPIVVMLAAMIPIGGAVGTTGAAAVLAEAMVAVAPGGAPLVPVGCMLMAAVVLTPFVNNPSTAVALAPIAAAVADSYGLPPAPFLAAVAVGASLDFLAPFGHHNNTLAMGMAGYRFGDFPRLGAPLTVLSLVVALAALQLFWL